MSSALNKEHTRDICDLAPRYIRGIAPYQPGKPISELAREFGLDADKIIKLASNENPLGVSPLAMKAMQAEGHNNFYKYLQAFGFTNATGIDVAAEDVVSPPAAAVIFR